MLAPKRTAAHANKTHPFMAHDPFPTIYGIVYQMRPTNSRYFQECTKINFGEFVIFLKDGFMVMVFYDFYIFLDIVGNSIKNAFIKKTGKKNCIG